MGVKQGRDGGVRSERGRGIQANLILMLIFVYFIIIFSSCQRGRGVKQRGGGKGGAGFDVATGEFVY